MDLKSILTRVCARVPILNSIRRWKAERRASRALQRHFTYHAAAPPQPCESDCGLRGIGFVPHAEMAVWRSRCYVAMAAFVLLLAGCLMIG